MNSKRTVATAISLLTMTLVLLLLNNIPVNVYAQKGGKSSDIPGNAMNSKYLSITDQKYTKGDFSDTITGTIQMPLKATLAFLAYMPLCTIAIMD